MLTRIISSATKRAVGIRCRGDMLAHQFGMTLPSAAAAAAPTSNNVMHHAAQRSFFTSPPLQSSSENDDGDASEKSSEDKGAMIQRWMKWNTSKTWKYEPNHELIAQIGKEGSKSPLDEFRDLLPREKREQEVVGRSWSVKELRRKSYDDLHKLWYVLYKEKNMLMTEGNLGRRHGYDMPQLDRRQKVRKSMGAIKHVLGERKRKKISDYRTYLEEVDRFDGIMETMKMESGDEIEDAMDTEAETMSANKEV